MRIIIVNLVSKKNQKGKKNPTIKTGYMILKKMEGLNHMDLLKRNSLEH
jgi:hypothetical protein